MSNELHIARVEDFSLYIGVPYTAAYKCNLTCILQKLQLIGSSEGGYGMGV